MTTIMLINFKTCACCVSFAAVPDERTSTMNEHFISNMHCVSHPVTHAPTSSYVKTPFQHRDRRGLQHVSSASSRQQNVEPFCRTAAAAIDPSTLVIQNSTIEQYYPAADLHATVFEHSTTPNQALWQRFERIWALQINDNLVENGAGSCVLLIAFDPARTPAGVLTHAAAATAAAPGTPAPADSSHHDQHHQQQQQQYQQQYRQQLAVQPESPQLAGYVFPRLGYWLSRTIQREVWQGLGKSFEDLGIVGVVQIDSFGDLIPPRTLDPWRDGAFGWIRREGIAYISNVAVAPAFRRCGVAVRLMAEAEALAAEWGCKRAALHCNSKNDAAMTLYRRLNYRQTVLEPPWMPYLQGRAPDRCSLMLKRLKTHPQQQQDAAAESVVLTEDVISETAAAAAS